MESSSELEVTNYTFSDLVDILAFSKILESFFKGTGVPNALIDENGEIISRSGWNKACTSFHHVNPQSHKNCLESNLELIHKLHTNKVSHNLCKNGLLEYATPIVIEGHRLATLFLGQVLNSSPDITAFQEQADKYGYDKEAYMDAILSVSIVSSQQMESLMECMVGMAQMLATNGLVTLRQNMLEQDLHKSTKQRIQLEDILNFSPIAIGWSNLNGKIEYINHQFTELFGYTLEDIPDIDTYYSKVYPDEDYRKNVILPWYNAVISAYENGTTPPEIEGNLTCKDGSQRHIVIRIAWIGELRLVNFSDMTAHWKSEQRNRAHDAMLEMVAKGFPLPEILNTIVQVIEAEEPTSKCSILLLDEEGKHLLSGAALNLPEFYNEAINGIEIGLGVGSCGTAAYLKERVVVEDIMTHEYWKHYKELAQKADLRACWAEPIVSSFGKVLGTFAIYYTKP
ncbi:MAG: PocR ligand-binding domain-containing protein, partial [Thiovulaceae bacterium]|nr:PocR ligand-binding domain-containing protein [Sulfurimonadaceae bacterium]